MGKGKQAAGGAGKEGVFAFIRIKMNWRAKGQCADQWHWNDLPPWHDVIEVGNPYRHKINLRALSGKVVKTGFEGKKRLFTGVAAAFGEKDQGMAFIQGRRHLGDGIIHPFLWPPVDKDGVEDITADKGAKGRGKPVIQRRPEIIHGLRNLIQNAVDFAASTVQVESTWTGDKVVLRIVDDGMGFPPSVLGRLGNPFLRRRTGTESRNARPGYEGMGLGLFIAKTLLERSGAKVSFSNGGGKVTGTGATGAIVTVEWPRDAVDPSQDRGFGPLGNNAPFGS